MIAISCRRRPRAAVVKLHTDDREDVVADGASLIEAETLYAMRITGIPQPARTPALDAEPEPHPPMRPTDRGQLAVELLSSESHADEGGRSFSRRPLSPVRPPRASISGEPRRFGARSFDLAAFSRIKGSSPGRKTG